MTQTTLSRNLYKEIRDVLTDHFTTEEDRVALLFPLKSSLPNTFKDIDFEDASRTFTTRLISLLQQHPDELDVVLDELTTLVGIDKAKTINDLRERVHQHYLQTRPHAVQEITETVRDENGNVVPTSQQILHTLDKLSAEAPQRADQRKTHFLTRLLWQAIVFTIVVGASALTDAMADAFVASVGVGGLAAALFSSAIQYFVRVEGLPQKSNRIPRLINGLARGLGWLSATLLGGLLGWLLVTIVGAGWGLAVCIYALPLIYAIWALLPPQQADYLIDARMDVDPRTKDLYELRDRVRRYWLEGILRRGLEEQVGEMNINLEQNALIYDENAGEFRVEDADDGDIPRTSMSVYRLYRHFAYRFFILGEPGSGKTIMLLRLAADMLADKHRPYLPLVLNLSSYRGGDLADWVVREAATIYNVSEHTLRDWHDRRLFALLLDGLDEIPDDAPQHYRAQCARTINGYLAAQDANRDAKRVSVVVCSRVAEHTLMLRDNPDAQLHALANRLTLQPLERSQIDTIITPERYPVLHATMQDDPILRGEEVAGVPFLLNAMVYAYGHAQDANELALLAGESGIIARRNHLIRAYLLRRFEDPKPLADPPDDLLRWLRWIAARTLATGTIFRVGVLDVRWIEDRDGRQMTIYRFVLWGLFGVLVALPLALFASYWLWQGAVAVFQWGIWGSVYGWISSSWWTWILSGAVALLLVVRLVRSRAWYWENVLTPAGKWLWEGLLTPYLGPRVAWSLAQGRERLPGNLPGFNESMVERQVMRPLGGGYAFRHRYLEQHLVQGSEQAEVQVAVLIERMSNPDQREAARDGLLALLGSRSAVAHQLGKALNGPVFALPVRLEIGKTLAEWGDDRYGVTTTETRDGVAIPVFDWVTIPAGQFLYGDDKRELTIDYDYQISRYPVTYAQFQTFIDDSEGFSDSRWWDDLADNERRRANQREPGEQWFKFWNHPRENVSWYDAIAFCRWLSWRLGGGFELDKIDEWAVRLPTEFEWEKAARGTNGREYPWGDGYRIGHANINETGSGPYYLRQTTAVGLYPQGASPYGVLDMSGNVWEWCLTDYHSPQPRAEDEDIRSDAVRVLRGGSWYGLHSIARAASRYSRYPNYRDNDGGFRVVCLPGG